MALAQRSELSARESGNLIGSDKVEGTPVYRPNQDRVGTIERVMIDKLTGKVGYAVMSFGGILGIGDDYYPIPWSLLTYNTALGGYEVNITEDQLKGAPKLRTLDAWSYHDREKESELLDYYGSHPYW
ncbi:MAG: PRC-barrel domain-containing protein [Rhizomicrobium sp.]|nr:PRC-barrel domain-containing protein [Rhizomicrobium sp.]